MNDLENVQDRAADVLREQLKEAKGKPTHAGRDRAAVYLSQEIAQMLIKFCYQSADFAAAVVERKGTLYECAKAIVKDNWDTGISDVVAYAEAVKYYMPGARVRATFRVDAPEEEDDDLLFDTASTAEEHTEAVERTAVILDLFGGED